MSELMDKIDRIEAEGVLPRLGLNGIDVWPLLRVRLIQKTKRTDSLRIREIFSVCRILLNEIVQVVRDLLTLQFLRKSESPTVVFFSHPGCLAKYHRSWYDRYCDPIVDELLSHGMRSEILEYSASTVFKSPTALPRRSVNLPLIFAKVISWPIAMWTKFWRKAELDRIDSLIEEGGIAEFISAAELNKLSAFVLFAKWVLVMRLRLLRCKVGFVCCYYSSSAMAFVAACRTLGVPVYDIQHGVQGQEHVAYHQWVFPDDRSYETLPTGFWCWDNESANCLKQWCTEARGEKVVVGGNVWIEYLFNQLERDDPFYAPSARRRVLISLQPLAQPLRPLLITAIMDSAVDIEWVVRMHPVMTASQVDMIVATLKKVIDEGRLIVQSDEHTPLPLVLPTVSLHVTEFSSVVLESASIGLPSVEKNKKGLMLYRHLTPLGLVYYAGSSSELSRLMDICKPYSDMSPRSGLTESAVRQILLELN